MLKKGLVSISFAVRRMVSQLIWGSGRIYLWISGGMSQCRVEDPEDHDSWSGRGSLTAGLTAVCGRYLQDDEGGNVGLIGWAEGLFVRAWSVGKY